MSKSERFCVLEQDDLNILCKRYDCNKCSKMFANFSDFKSHLCPNDQTKPYLCYICNNRFPTTQNLENHNCLNSVLRRRCNNNKGYVAKSSSNSIQVDKKKYVCTFCQRGFASPYFLKKHNYFHSCANSNNSKMSVKTFSKKKNLSNDHLKDHAYSQDEEISHVNVHYRRFCDKEYPKKQFYAHFTEASYACKMCEKKYICNDFLKRHIRFAHGVKK